MFVSQRSDHRTVSVHRLLLHPEDYRSVQQEDRLHRLLWEAGQPSQNLSDRRHHPHAQSQGPAWITNMDPFSSHVLYYQIKNILILFKDFDDRNLKHLKPPVLFFRCESVTWWWMIPCFSTQTQFFNDSITLVNTFGFSVVTFDGTVGGAVEPRASSRSFHFDQEDRRTVEELRSWAANQTVLPSAPTIPLSAVQPKAYFDLTCQLLARADIDCTCTLLRVRRPNSYRYTEQVTNKL